MDETRHSQALEPAALTDSVQIAEAEARNGLRQFDAGIQIIRTAIENEENGYPFKLRVSTILSLHREALRGISSYAGLTRPGSVEISLSKHTPPDAHLVQELLEDLCEYVNKHWDVSSALQLSSYVMWRLNWIHPFADGNGRTSRIVSYVVLCIQTGYVLPGSSTIPQYIAQDKKPYYAALDAADEAEREGRVDVSAMEHLLEALLAKQLSSVYQHAGGRVSPPPSVL